MPVIPILDNLIECFKHYTRICADSFNILNTQCCTLSILFKFTKYKEGQRLLQPKSCDKNNKEREISLNKKKHEDFISSKISNSSHHPTRGTEGEWNFLYKLFTSPDPL